MSKSEANVKSETVETNKDMKNFNDKKDLEFSCEKSEFNRIEKGKIIFSKIEDIPTRPDRPKLSETKSPSPNPPMNEKNELNKKETSTKLKFELNFPQKRISVPSHTQSTFAELSNKLGPTVSFNTRKLGINHNIKNPLLEPKAVEVNKKEKKDLVKCHDFPKE